VLASLCARYFTRFDQLDLQDGVSCYGIRVCLPVKVFLDISGMNFIIQMFIHNASHTSILLILFYKSKHLFHYSNVKYSSIHS
jgi:hypothetical protein